MDAPIHRQFCEVAFGDTDASGWMHFPNAFRYLEAAEHAFLRSRGVLVHDPARGGWPRVNAGADFKRPLRAGDKIEVLLRIGRVGVSSVSWDFEILDPAGETAVTGGMTSVRVDGTGKALPIPEDERARLLARD